MILILLWLLGAAGASRKSKMAAGPTAQSLLDLVAPGPISCVCEVPRLRQPRHPRHRLT